MKLGTLCYIEQNNKYLMLHRTKKENDFHKDLWVGLGGKIERGESPEECVIREVYEESGLVISNPRLRGILTFPDFSSEDWYVFLFTASDFSGELTQCNEGELDWIDIDALDALPMHEGDRHFLRWVKEYGGVFSAKLTYEGDTFMDYSFNNYDL